MSAIETHKSWYLVYCKPCQEQIAKTNLERQGYRVYLPMVRHMRRRAGHYVTVVEALFPRYLFIYLDCQSDNWRPIRSTLGVSSMVRFGLEPAVVPPELVETLMQRDNDQGVQIISCDDYPLGAPLRIVEGPLMGYEGILLAKSSKERVVMLLDLIGKQVRVEVDRIHLERQTEHAITKQ